VSVCEGRVKTSLHAGVDSSEWRKISAAWAVDEDISRLLKSLPNYTSLMTLAGYDSPVAMRTPVNAKFTSSSGFGSATTPTPIVESAEQVCVVVVNLNLSSFMRCVDSCTKQT
jgi:hypothetical protein